MSFTITLFISEVNQLSFIFNEQQAFHLKRHILLKHHLISREWCLYEKKKRCAHIHPCIQIPALTFLEDILFYLYQ